MRVALGFINSGLVVLFCVSILFAQDRYALDLTVDGQSPAPAKTGFGCGPRLTGGSEPGGFVKPTLALALDIIALDKSTYAPGEDFVCRVRFTNTGREPIRVPWSPNSQYSNKDCTGALKDTAKASLSGSLRLVLMSGSGLARSIPAPSLYGRLEFPDTYRVLAPGQSATVKFKQSISLQVTDATDPAGQLLDLPQDFSVTAAYDLDDTSQANPYETVRSQNNVMVTVLGVRSKP